MGAREREMKEDEEEEDKNMKMVVRHERYMVSSSAFNNQ